ncbi:MAG: alpha-amylase family glycosyl hydrolase, partial [Verrucomicrobiota bacterium]|nr:alpha-amylase family glycosyl hydrolase [Verrucomicrobiota bacterium]
MKLFSVRAFALYSLFGAALLSPVKARGEAMIQYFNTDWNEIALKMPELAEAGYDSIWIPPPTKGSGGLSVGYDLWDRFDLGSKDQRGSVRTRYGTEAELLRMIEVAHRFGIRVYLDNIMNHNAFDVPGFNAQTPIDVYPGFVPEDFHLRVTPEGFYRKWDNTRDWNSAWQVQHLGLADLIDIAQEPGPTNENFGTTEGSTFPKIKLVRHPNNPEFYCYKPDGTYVGFGPNNGITKEMLAANPGFYGERVEDMLNRSARWLIDRTKADGLRLDAVKHVRYDFFGASFGADKDSSDYGYTGQVQRQFNLTRGFSDTNHRDSVFDTEKPRDDAMMFGEHLGEPPPYGDYFNVGMRLVDNVLRSNLNGILGNPSTGLFGLDAPGSYGFDAALAVFHAQSHDNDYAARRELQHALYFTRAGIGLIYTDGNHQAQTLGQSGGAFPRHANTAFLGQFNDPRIPNLLYIHNQFARGIQLPKFSDADFVAYERVDKRENPSMSDADGVTLLFLLNDNYASGQGRQFSTSFPSTAFGSNAYLYNYSSYGGGFYKYANEITNGSVVVPPGGYFAFSWKNPDESDLWKNGGGSPITILQNGQPTGTLTYLRKDGPDGDPNFNPYNVAGAVAGTYSYPFTIPRITDASSLSFIARVDGSAENILLELDGGVDLNGTVPAGNSDPGKRDFPPAVSTDVFLGYEQPTFVDRQGPEKFAAINTAHCTFGSAGAETYTAGGATVPGNGTNPQDAAAATFVYHDPNGGFDSWSGAHPATQFVDNGSTFDVWAKTNSVGGGFRMFVYYTSDGSNPEGAGGFGIGTTKVAEMLYAPPNTNDNGNWWTKASAPRPAGTLKYKIGIFKTVQPSIFPVGADEVVRKTKMMTTFKVANFNGTTALVYPHNDYATTQSGLSEGFHVLRARSFLNRVGRASIYNTFTQSFYYDAQPPTGEIKFPNENDSLGDSKYGVVVRTDPSVTEVWYHIDDSDASNNDTSTHTQGGNGTGFEPFTDVNGNGTWDVGEPFEDLNKNGVWDNNIPTSWVRATEVTATPAINSSYPREWRFNFNNIPSSGVAQIKVRLRELSSADYKDFNLSDAAGHYTTLTRTVNTNGPATRMFVAFPSNDGDLVDSNYIAKVWFSRSLSNGTTTQQLINRFLIKLASSESGSPANGVPQNRAAYTINYNVDGPNGQYHELAFQLPNLYNDNPSFLHTIDVTYTNPGSPTLDSTRLVRARPVATIKDVIVSPPEVDSDGKPYEVVLPDVANPTAAQRAVAIRVETDTTATNVAITFSVGVGNVTLNGPATPSPNGNSLYWDFTWNNASPGTYQFVSTVTAPAGTSTATRNAHVVLRQLVSPNPNKGDVDDDGLGLFGPTAAPIETTTIPLPTTNSETWTNGEVHVWAISGRTDPLNPDTDGDELSDGLELGWGGAVGDTDTTADTNGDGIPNFQPDLDPPIFNTTDNASAPAGYEYFSPWPYDLNRSRTDLLAGSMTNPAKIDTDDDGVNDGLEDLTFLAKAAVDANGHATYRHFHNGRVDILPSGTNGEQVIRHPPTVYNTSRVDRSRVVSVSPNAMWLETDPNSNDTDNDGATDGQEDLNANGIVDLAIIERDASGNVIVDGQGKPVVRATMSDPLQPVTVQPSLGGKQPVTFYYTDFCFTYTEPTDGKTYVSAALDRAKLDAVFHPGGQFRADRLDVIWLETDPRRFSTSGDALPDGWKIRYGLDPWDDGIAGHYNLHTGAPANPINGVNGNPNGDGVTTNLQAYINGLDPREQINRPPPAPGSITIGPLPDNQAITFGSVVNKKEFTDWTANDLIALDPYDGDGSNNQQADIYHGYDGFDSSRDMVAFYAHDGGDSASGGDGNFYFRVDMQDLQPYAEQGNLDIYVAINFGQPGTGEFNLPDDVDTGTAMGWQAVVASYQTNVGRVYLWDKNSPTHSTAIGQNLTPFGVTIRDQSAANGFKKAYYNSELDAVEFSISRKALLDAGWNGDPTRLTYQVFTTRDGTINSPVGLGDIGGRSDIRDAIRNDWIASDYYLDQASIAGNNSVLRSWVGLNADNDRGKRVKVMSIVQGNQPIQPGSTTQNLINNNQGAGYYRPLDVHQAYDVPLTAHITPTLASAMQWAANASGPTKAYRDGPAFNARLAGMMNNGQLDLLGTTFSDHILPYFSAAFNADNVALANTFLSSIYGHAPSSKVFWTPERVSSSGVLQKVSGLGFGYTFVDQMRHLFKWFGRTSALGNDGYRVNQVANTKEFVINDGISSQLFANTDNGLPVLLRQLLSRKVRDSQQDQVVVFVNLWEDFAVKANADAYDKNIRWLASHPWIQIVTPDQIANGEVAYVANGTSATDWGTVTRGNTTLANVAKDFLDFATEENYDNWYFGSALEESLSNKKFNIRTGVAMPSSYGVQTGSGVVKDSWQALNGWSSASAFTGLRALAGATLHASVFETAFHDQPSFNLSKYSTGAYVYPDASVQPLAGFSKIAQSQTREAAIYARVNTWATAASSGSYANASVAEQMDIDLDGESEYLLYNDRTFALFERIGGRMTAAWLRDINSGYITQVVGNLANYSGSETEEEGAGNFNGTAVNAFRTSGFKDWFAKTNANGTGTFAYVNDLYSVTPAPGGNGWKFTSSDGKIAKTITLAAGNGALQASYITSGIVQLYVRFGLSPDLLDLLTSGQTHLTPLISSAQEVDLLNNNSNPLRSVRAFLRFGGAGYSGATFNPAASDADTNALDTVPMRNQAQTQQVEISGTGTMNFALGFETGASLTYDS